MFILAIILFYLLCYLIECFILSIVHTNTYRAYAALHCVCLGELEMLANSRMIACLEVLLSIDYSVHSLSLQLQENKHTFDILN